MFILNLSRNVFDAGTWSVWDRPFISNGLVLPLLVSAGLVIPAVLGLLNLRDRQGGRVLIAISIVAFLLWFLPDLVLGGRRSLVPRYLMPCWIALDIGLAFFIANRILSNGKRGLVGAGSLLLIMGLGASSFLMYFSTPNWWTSRPPSLAEDLQDIDFSRVSTVIADVDAGWPLISMSYAVPENVRFLLIDRDELSTLEMQPQTYLLFSFQRQKPTRNFVTRDVGSGKFLRWAVPR